MSECWMLDKVAEIDGEPIFEPFAEDERGVEIDAYLIARYVHAKQSLIVASVALHEAYSREMSARERRGAKA